MSGAIGDQNSQAFENRGRLFLIGVLCLFTAAFSFVLRAAVASDIQADYITPFDPINDGQLIGAALGVAFLGFALSLFITSPLLDIIGMGRMLICAAVFFIVGPLLVISADLLADGQGVYRLIWLGMLINGMGWGFTESTINPMTTALYPEDKTHRMNVIHAWWPAGIVAGGLLGVAIGQFDIDWRVAMGLVMVPPLVIIPLILGQTFPKTERAAMGVGFGDMITEIFRRPVFFIWLGAMVLTSATELAPGQWVDIALSEVVGMRGILLLVYVAAIMFVMRHFAGPIAHRISDIGLLWVSCLMAAVGLYLLSIASSPVTALLAATLWGAGVCFLWPTMISGVAERFPKGGAWTIGLIGSAGAGTIYFFLPRLGAIYDQAKLEAAGGADAFAALEDGPALDAVLAQAAQVSFQTVALMPLVLLLIFAGLWLLDRTRTKQPVSAPAE
ncbi:MAG: MFS transporter [Pseudomonadota bacterium]